MSPRAVGAGGRRDTGGRPDVSIAHSIFGLLSVCGLTPERLTLARARCLPLVLLNESSAAAAVVAAVRRLALQQPAALRGSTQAAHIQAQGGQTSNGHYCCGGTCYCSWSGRNGTFSGRCIFPSRRSCCSQTGCSCFHSRCCFDRRSSRLRSRRQCFHAAPPSSLHISVSPRRRFFGGRLAPSAQQGIPHG